MTTFIEITKVNSYGETGKAVIKVDNIIGLKQVHVEPTRLYDENGNLVSETPKANEYTILCERGDVFHIDETEYQRLVALLTANA